MNTASLLPDIMLSFLSRLGRLLLTLGVSWILSVSFSSGTSFTMSVSSPPLVSTAPSVTTSSIKVSSFTASERVSTKLVSALLICLLTGTLNLSSFGLRTASGDLMGFKSPTIGEVSTSLSVRLEAKSFTVGLK